MTPNKRRALLIERGIEQKAIAARLGIKAPTVYRTVKYGYGPGTSPRARRAVARALGKKIGELWPHVCTTSCRHPDIRPGRARSHKRDAVRFAPGIAKSGRARSRRHEK
jgi:hypothetical protein